MATTQLNAAAIYAQVALGLEKIDNGKPVAVPPMGPGDTTVQGDVYITRLDREIPGGKPASRQLAPGTTRGSRHVAEGDCDVLSVPEGDALRALDRLVPATRGRKLFVGPMIVARGPATITHPEHAHQTLEGDACYLVTIQRSYVREETRRAMD